MVVLDATFLIDLDDRHPGAIKLAESFDTSVPLRLPAAAWAEFLSGFSAEQRRSIVKRLERSVVCEPFTREIADEAARLQFDLARSGGVLAWHDLQVVATALWFREALVTQDGSFRRVAGVDLIQY